MNEHRGDSSDNSDRGDMHAAVTEETAVTAVTNTHTHCMLGVSFYSVPVSHDVPS